MTLFANHLYDIFSFLDLVSGANKGKMPEETLIETKSEKGPWKAIGKLQNCLKPKVQVKSGQNAVAPNSGYVRLS